MALAGQPFFPPQEWEPPLQLLAPLQEFLGLQTFPLQPFKPHWDFFMLSCPGKADPAMATVEVAIKPAIAAATKDVFLLRVIFISKLSFYNREILA